MKHEKLFILLPDGVGLRNFAYSDFYDLGLKRGFDIVFWNNTPFPISDMGFPEIRIKNKALHPLTDMYKNAKIQVELNLSIKKTNDHVYDSYRFPPVSHNLKRFVKNVLTNLLTSIQSSARGLLWIRNKIKAHERSTDYYRESLATLQIEKPAMVFCTNQRHITTVAPLLAARDLGIPTATFIFSWDNLPKATLVVETDYYLVWSELMKTELQFYYPHIRSEQIFVTGSPQFEMHFNQSKRLSRADFFKRYDLDIQKKYVCFTGNDVTSSADDPKYLKDIAEAVRTLNRQNFEIGIVFRKCPVDFSNRYDAVLKEYADEIVAIDPLWKLTATAWNSVLPTSEDDELLANIAEHCEMGITIGSSTVFDFISHGKPCAYLRYNQKTQLDPTWDVYRCYEFVHFRSMPSEEAVLWMDSPEAIAKVIVEGLKHPRKTIEQAELWFQKINLHPANQASSRILETIEKIITLH